MAPRSSEVELEVDRPQMSPTRDLRAACRSKPAGACDSASRRGFEGA